MKIIKYGFLGFILVLTGMISSEVSAQDTKDTERIEALRDMVKSESFNVSGLIHARGVYSFDENGSRFFRVPHARIKVNGKLDGGFSYNVHFDAAASSTVVDAFIGYKINDKANLTIGIQKPGVSYEYLTAPHKVDFVTRSTVVSTLTSHRDIGLRMHGGLTDAINYSFGVFNGNGYGSNDNNKFFYAGRLNYDSSLEEGSLIVGVNASYGEHENRNLSSNLPTINGDRLTYGADLRFDNSSIILASEVLGAELEYTGFTEIDNVFGFHVTGGYKISGKTHALLRYESFNSDLLAPSADREQIVIGLNRYPTGQTGFKINYLLPVDDTGFSNHGLQLNYYISF
ncbi:MAG: porin [Gracilimonas sp.]